MAQAGVVDGIVVLHAPIGTSLTPQKVGDVDVLTVGQGPSLLQTRTEKMATKMAVAMGVVVALTAGAVRPKGALIVHPPTNVFATPTGDKGWRLAPSKLTLMVSYFK